MTPSLPPGILYLSSHLFLLVGPPVITVALLYTLENFLEIIDLKSSPLRLLILIWSWPALFFFDLFIRRWSNRRRAAALGAVLPPPIPTKWPAGLDLTARMIADEKKSYIGDPFHQYCKQLGGIFNVYTLYEDRILLSEPEYVKTMLATDFANFEKGARQRLQLGSVLGTGVFCSDGEMWKFHRSMTRPFFSKDRISHFDIFGRHADEAIDLLSTRLQERYAVDMQDVMMRFTLDSATEFLLGSCVHSLSAGLSYPYNAPRNTDSSIVKAETIASRHPANLFAKAFGDALLVTAKRSRYGSLWPLVEFWKDGTKEHMSVLREFVDPILREAIEKKRSVEGKKELEDSDTLLDNLVNHTDNPTILRDETLNILIAGRDTTAALLTFVVYALSMHPEVLVRLRNEILNKLGSSRRPTYEELRDMKYLRAVINETLRLFPPIPFDMRENLHETTWRNAKNPSEPPYYIPAGTKCIYSALLMHRREELWGPDAENFDPDRFLDERLHKYLTPNPFIFVPFHAGPRICLGQQFAYNEASFMIIRLLQHFDHIELAPDAQPADTLPPADWVKGVGRRSIEKIFVKAHLTSYANGGLWVRMREAQAVETV